MHQLHYLIVEEESAEEAAHFASARIDDWGNENNWKSIGGVIRLDFGEIIKCYDEMARWESDYIMNNHNYILKFRRADQIAIQLIKDEYNLTDTAINNDLKDLFEKSLNNNFASDDVLREELKELLNRADLQSDIYNKRNSINAWEFDKIGITNLNSFPEDPKTKNYLLLLDTHI